MLYYIFGGLLPFQSVVWLADDSAGSQTEHDVTKIHLSEGSVFDWRPALQTHLLVKPQIYHAIVKYYSNHYITHLMFQPAFQTRTCEAFCLVKTEHFCIQTIVQVLYSRRYSHETLLSSPVRYLFWTWCWGSALLPLSVTGRTASWIGQQYE